MQGIYDFDPIFPHEHFRVGFIGSQSVGKTKQINKLAKYLRIPTITEGARHVMMAMGYSRIENIKDVALFQWKVLAWQIQHEQQYGNFLSDRSTLDNAAYFARYAAPELGWKEASSYFKRAFENAENYTHLIYFPIMWDGVDDDGVRHRDTSERKAVDALVQEYIQNKNVASKVYTITTDDDRDGEDARLIEIVDALGLHLLSREMKLHA